MFLRSSTKSKNLYWGISHGVVDNVLDFYIVVSNFELQFTLVHSFLDLEKVCAVR